MTEQSSTTGSGAAVDRQERTAHGATTQRRPTPRPRPARSRLARNPLPVIAGALASFMVVLVLLTARVVSGHDPGLRAPSAAVVVSHRGHQVLRTTASGRVIAVGSQGTSGTPSARPAAIVTRTSGAASGGGLDDE